MPIKGQAVGQVRVCEFRVPGLHSGKGSPSTQETLLGQLVEKALQAFCVCRLDLRSYGTAPCLLLLSHAGLSHGRRQEPWGVPWGLGASEQTGLVAQ